MKKKIGDVHFEILFAILKEVVCEEKIILINPL